jgi:transposase-like protein
LEGRYPYLFLDAKVEKVSDGGRVVGKALVIAHGVHETGRREILSIDVGEAETEAFWTDFLRGLVKRGPVGVQLAISDAHAGLKAAIAKVLGCAWQRCTRSLPPRLPRARPSRSARSAGGAAPADL